MMQYDFDDLMQKILTLERKVDVLERNQIINADPNSICTKCNKIGTFATMTTGLGHKFHKYYCATCKSFWDR